MTVPLPCYRCVEVEAHPERIDRVHRILAAHLAHWTLDRQITPVCAGVRELLANVAEHAGDGTAVIELIWTGRHLIASVADQDHRPPRPLGPERGGLARVAALSDGWGSCGTPDGGKVVWFCRRVETAEGQPLVWPAPVSVLRESRPGPGSGPVPALLGPPARGAARPPLARWPLATRCA
ncbi:ATP-binding protein [Streptomyces uncialis]|uniref:ATP-binding protein n=1 Tax=Streptomyces uncialis TaxID=1048205 RepID=UPI00381580C4